MRPYVLNKIVREDVILLDKIRKVIQAFDVNLGKDDYGKEIELSCHMVARAVAAVFDLEFKDGYFYPNFEHSWIVTKYGNIIDVYPIAILIDKNGGPLLIDGDHSSPARWLYKENDYVKKDFMQRIGSQRFKESVEKVENSLLKCNFV